MIHNSEQTRKFMDNIKNANLKFKVDEDIEKRVLKEQIEKEIEDITKIGNVDVGFFQQGNNITAEFSKGGQTIEYNMKTAKTEDFMKLLQFLQMNA